ncbi:MAG: acetamidase/formamidase family protein, partial [Peptostreptococcaceae bacterium]
VYFPIYHDGALLSMGDVHAVMGDGEVGVSGAEIGANVTVKVEVINDVSIKNPVVETDDAFYTIGSGLTLDDAYKIAIDDMFDLLCQKSDMDKNDLAMLMSLTGDLEICQVVDPLKTVRFKVSKELLGKLNINRFI